MKKRIQAMILRLEGKKKELSARSNATDITVAELRSINTELDGINTDLAEARGMLADEEAREAAAAEKIAADGSADPEARDAVPGEGDDPEARGIIGTFGVGGQAAEARDAAIQKIYDTKGADLRSKKAITVSMVETEEEARATTVASSNLIVQKKYSNTLNETFNEVSSLIDNVNAVSLPGGNSYTKGFEVSFDEADYTTETGAYTDGDPVTDYVEIGKAKITAYAEITDEASVLPNVAYQALVVKNVRIAIRKKITKQLLIGAGGNNAITGIFNAPVNVIPLATDLEFSAIDADTLDQIILGYGGDEDVEGGAVLIINKQTLANFAAIRTSDGNKLYKITIDTNGNTGTLSSEGSWNVPYILNSAVAKFDSVAEDAYFGAYGKLQAYEMPVFSPLTVQESTDFKFSTGQIAYRGSVWTGGNVASYKGFVRLKKIAVA